MVTDIFSDTVTRIRNASRIKSHGVEIEKTKITSKFAQILVEEGVIEEVIEVVPSVRKKGQKQLLFIRLKYRGLTKTPVITRINRISSPSLRVYAKCRSLPRNLSSFGLILVSTSQGLITERERMHKRLGGELMCSIWLITAMLTKTNFKNFPIQLLARKNCYSIKVKYWLLSIIAYKAIINILYNRTYKILIFEKSNSLFNYK